MLKKFLTFMVMFLFVFNLGINSAFSRTSVKLSDLPPIPALPDLSTLPKVVLQPPSPPTNVEKTPIKPMVTSPCLPGGSFDQINPSNDEN